MHVMPFADTFDPGRVAIQVTAVLQSQVKSFARDCKKAKQQRSVLLVWPSEGLF